MVSVICVVPLILTLVPLITVTFLMVAPLVPPVVPHVW